MGQQRYTIGASQEETTNTGRQSVLRNVAAPRWEASKDDFPHWSFFSLSRGIKIAEREHLPGELWPPPPGPASSPSPPHFAQQCTVGQDGLRGTDALLLLFTLMSQHRLGNPHGSGHEQYPRGEDSVIPPFPSKDTEAQRHDATCPGDSGGPGGAWNPGCWAP